MLTFTKSPKYKNTYLHCEQLFRNTVVRGNNRSLYIEDFIYNRRSTDIIQFLDTKPFPHTQCHRQWGLD